MVKSEECLHLKRKYDESCSKKALSPIKSLKVISQLKMTLKVASDLK